MMILYSAAHFILLYLYQIPVFQDHMDPNNFSARFVGLTPLMSFNCPSYWEFAAPSKQSWTYYVNFVFVFALYHLLILQYRWTRMGIRYGCDMVYSEDSSVHQEVILIFKAFFRFCTNSYNFFLVKLLWSLLYLFIFIQLHQMSEFSRRGFSHQNEPILHKLKSRNSVSRDTVIVLLFYGNYLLLWESFLIQCLTHLLLLQNLIRFFKLSN